MKADRNVILHPSPDAKGQSRIFMEGEEIPEGYQDGYVPMTQERRDRAAAKRANGGKIAAGNDAGNDQVTAGNVTQEVPDGDSAEVLKWVAEASSPEEKLNRAAAANDQERLRKRPRKGVLGELEEILEGKE